MIGVVALFEVVPGREAEFEAVMTGFVQEVREKETGVTYFDFYRHMGAPNLFVMMERYESEAAFRAHGEAPHFRELETSLTGLLAQAPNFNVHQLVI